MNDAVSIGETGHGTAEDDFAKAGAREPMAESQSQQQWVADAFARYERPLLAYACRMSGSDWNAAQDAVQETFLRLCREDPSSVSDRLAAWLFTVCRSRIIDMKRRKSVLPTSEQAAAVADTTTSPSAVIEADEQSQELARMVDQLSPRQQEVLRLRLQAELSYREIADITGLSVSNVGFHLHAAVRSLRGAMLGT